LPENEIASRILKHLWDTTGERSTGNYARWVKAFGDEVRLLGEERVARALRPELVSICIGEGREFLSFNSIVNNPRGAIDKLEAAATLLRERKLAEDLLSVLCHDFEESFTPRGFARWELLLAAKLAGINDERARSILDPENVRAAMEERKGHYGMSNLPALLDRIDRNWSHLVRQADMKEQLAKEKWTTPTYIHPSRMTENREVDFDD